MMRIGCVAALFFIVLTAFTLRGEIIETKRMNELYQHLEPGMMVVFDIDNTLIEPTQELGTDQWFGGQIKKYESYNMPFETAQKNALREWRAVQYITDVKLVEKGIDQIIADLQRKGVPVMGLTTRGMEMCVRAVDQLESVNVDLEKTAPIKEELYFFNGKGVVYTGGILFTNNTPKGLALRKFLEGSEYHPKSILFVNDKLSHIKPLEEMCREDGIKFIGLRYGYLDEKVRNMRPHIAEVQWKHFGQILSDQAAEKILSER
jgi:phosphoglycolate phosphatase-like HAD superfamily hydrolase